MSNTQNLLPCAFCGGMATAKPIDSVPGWHHVTVLHSDCFYKPAQDKMLLNDEHLAAWNRRTPQQEAQEPLTDAQIAEMMRDTWGCASIAPRHALEFARAIERAHGIGIKGGQHGTDTWTNYGVRTAVLRKGPSPS